MLKDLFNRRRAVPLLGVDISSHYVKVLELERDARGYVVAAYAVAPLPPNAVVDKNIADVERVADALNLAVARSRSPLKDCAVAVPGSSVITKVIEMPADLNEEEMESQITLEADQYIPFPLDEVAMDFDVQDLSESNPEQVEVLVAACRLENVDQRSEVLEFADMKPRVVDVEAYALERALQTMAPAYKVKPEDLVAVIDIGALSTTISVLQNDQTVYTREQPFGGQLLTEEIQRRYGLSAEEAERAKKEGGLPEDYEAEVLVPFRESVVQQISRTLQFFYAASHYNEVSLVLLAGGVAAMPDLAEQVSSELSVRAAIANPFAGMALGKSVDKESLRRDAPGLMIACGLALRSFD